MDRDRTAPGIARADEAQPAALLCLVERFLLIARRQSARLRDDPDLQEMHGRRLRRVELAVPNASARRHPLHITRPDDRTGAEAVLMLERAVEHIRDDFHIGMRMFRKPAALDDAIIVDHAQWTKPHMPGIVILAERERMPAVEPTEIGPAAVVGFPDRECHRCLQCGNGHRSLRIDAYVGRGSSKFNNEPYYRDAVRGSLARFGVFRTASCPAAEPCHR